MLHPINPPSCIPELEALIDLQRKTLEYACAHKKYSDISFRLLVGKNFTDWLKKLKTSAGKASQIGNRFFNELDIYIKCPPVDKRQIIDDFVADQTYYQRISDSTFLFSLIPQKSTSYLKAGELLVRFYDLLGIGFPPLLVNHPASSPLFKKESVVTGYKTTNPQIEYICPCCDSTFTENPSANDQGYTLEHYFPKSLYPSICLHPLNLIPMCSGCNSHKMNIDPLNPSVTPLVRVAYEEAFHPIARPVRHNASLNFRTRATVPDEMEFVSINPSQTLQNAIAAYRILYQIPDRWEKNWLRVDHQVQSYLHRASKYLNYQPTDDQSFDISIQHAIEDMTSDLGQQHFCYPALNWLTWARTHKFQELKQSFKP